MEFLLNPEHQSKHIDHELRLCCVSCDTIFTFTLDMIKDNPEYGKTSFLSFLRKVFNSETLQPRYISCPVCNAKNFLPAVEGPVCKFREVSE